ncbi:hypothetical protein QA649_23385 [Bradyrhizobium sp. CB1717]|uniref:DUF6894 family protein n=1 Tax=Bradyrhizobium sp. CB1717 TaxID=3039154 RepID=UPI0024B23FE9|nr:hypothetical protein [Bradyrhizobium sp. CB1717]WFU21066.1 hypothetical protein QA649_23385 [Bradyrhizobium sp. CB1717]
MPKYYFNVRDLEPSTDEFGEELPDNEAAWKQATGFAGEVLKDMDGRFRPGQEWAVEVTDEQKRMLYRIEISSRKRK